MGSKVLFRAGRARGLSARVGIGIASGGLLAAGSLAAAMPAHAAGQATVTCPTVASNGTVTPPPPRDADWSGCDLQNAYLAGFGLGHANLSGANLSQANLTGASLAYADLSGADLTGATLTGVISGGITDSPPATLPANWTLAGGYLMG